MEAGTEQTSRIVSIATAVPAYGARQEKILEFMHDAYAEPLASRKLNALFHNSGIASRYSVVPDFQNLGGNLLFVPQNGTPALDKRMDVYRRDALPLALEAIRSAFAKLKTSNTADITHLITVSCTGLYAPGLDAEIIGNLPLSPDIFHTSLNFLGCNAAFPALKIADAIVRADKNAKVLIVCVELCTIHFRAKDNADSLLSNTIFSDGAAAAIMTSGETALLNSWKGLRMNGFHSFIQQEGKHLMGWHVNPVNFEMVLDSSIPEFLGNGLHQLRKKIENALRISYNDIKHWAVHPGGKKILDEVRRSFQLEQIQLKHSYGVLQMYGNMSSPTVLFVLASILDDRIESGDLVFSMGFGPGICIDSAVMTYE